MLADAQGNPTSAANPEAVRWLEDALDCFLHFRGSILDGIVGALAADPDFALAHALDGYLGVLATEPLDAARARERFDAFMGRLNPSNLLERERLHLRAADTLLAGDFHGAGAILEEISTQYPRDLLALAVGHQIDFFTGNSRMLRDRIGAVMQAWTPEDANHANLMGMLAFGLEEMHQHDRAFEVGMEAVERNPRDVWALHAVGHTFEETGRFDDGARYYTARSNHWTTGNYFILHNWWHYALFQIEANRVDRALEVHDAVLSTGNPDIALQLLDASALLWRLKLEGFEERERFRDVARKWQRKLEPAFYAFNDMHMMMALVGAGFDADAETLIASRERYVASSLPASVNNVAMTRNIGLPVCKALLAFGRGQYAQVINHLYPIRRRIHEFGGSHAQRDAVLKTLIEAALRAGRFELANAMISERISVRPRSPYNWLKHAVALEGLGQVTQATIARDTANKRLSEARISG
jgi:tetratricopeptide (TPR) repeat protein